MRFSLILLTISSALAQDAGATHADWPHYGGTQFSWRYSALDQINTANVKSLTPAWMFQTGDYAENLQATPIVIDGVMYLITARAPRIRARRRNAAASSGATTIPNRRAMSPVSSGARGLAVSDGKVFFGTRDNYMVALDQKSGRQAMESRTSTTRASADCNITPPRWS